MIWFDYLVRVLATLVSFSFAAVFFCEFEGDRTFEFISIFGFVVCLFAIWRLF